MLSRLVKFQVNAAALRVNVAALRRDRGATAVEYGLMVALIAVVIIGGVTFLGTQVSSLFQSVAGKV